MLFVCHPKFCISIVFSFSWGVKVAPRETESNNAYAKFWGDKQRSLWYVIVFSGVVNWQSNPVDRTGFYNSHHHHHHRHRQHYNGILTFQQQLALLCQKKKLFKQVQYNGKYKFRIDLNLTIS